MRLAASKKMYFVLLPFYIFVLLEIGARLMGASDWLESRLMRVSTPAGQLEIGSDTAYRFDTKLIVALKPGLKDHAIDRLAPVKLSFRFSTDSSGFRVVPDAPSDARAAIVTLGDSCTFGYGVSDTEAWPVKLQENINRAPALETSRYRVINAGVPGYTVFEGYRSLENLLPAKNVKYATACFDFNDCLSLFGLTDIEIAGIMERPDWFNFLRKSEMVRFFDTLENGRSLKKNIQAMTTRSPRMRESDYTRYFEMLIERCKKNDVHLLLLLWPLEVQLFPDAPNSGQIDTSGFLPEYCHRQALLTNLAHATNTDILDIGACYLKSGKNSGDLFLDGLHPTATATGLVADSVFATLFPENQNQ